VLGALSNCVAKLTNALLDWTQEDTEVPGDNTHLWEESWDDDDTSEDFSAQLKYALSPCVHDLLLSGKD
jgi:hypothetical protein